MHESAHTNNIQKEEACYLYMRTYKGKGNPPIHAMYVCMYVYQCPSNSYCGASSRVDFDVFMITYFYVLLNFRIYTRSHILIYLLLRTFKIGIPVIKYHPIHFLFSACLLPFLCIYTGHTIS